jgi:hypothetical protein
MSLRDLELLEALRRDDLAYVLTTRYEKPLEALLADDTPFMLTYLPSPMMAAAFFGATKCFQFFLRTGRTDYRDHYGVPLFLFATASTLPPPGGTSRYSRACSRAPRARSRSATNWGTPRCTTPRSTGAARSRS